MIVKKSLVKKNEKTCFSSIIKDMIISTKTQKIILLRQSVYSKGRICLQPLIKSWPKIQEKFVISKERENQTLVLHQYIIDTEIPF